VIRTGLWQFAHFCFVISNVPHLSGLTEQLRHLAGAPRDGPRILRGARRVRYLYSLLQRRAVHLCPSRTLIQLHSSFAGGNAGQVGMDDVLLPAPPLDPDAALDPVALLDP